MHARTRRVAIGVASLTPILAILAGCSLLNAPNPQNTTAANDAAAARFVTCLTQQGQTAKILHGGMVGMLLPADTSNDTVSGGGQGGDGAASGETSVIKDGDGVWQASSTAEGYPDEGGMRDAWAACAKKIPEFKQPVPAAGGDTVSSAQQAKLALAFAKCARRNGFADFPDPADDGSLNLPSGLTEDGFRSLLDECFDPKGGAGIMISKDSIDNASFSVRSAIEDFFAAHPKYGGPATSQHHGPDNTKPGDTSGNK